MKQLVLTLLASLLVVGCTPTAIAEQDVARTISEWQQINPALTQYRPMHDHWVPAMGIHWGVPGPHVTIGIAHDDVVAVVEVIFPAEDGWYPWFDQPEGEPMELEGFGLAYTQHIWLTDPATVNPGQTPEFLPLTLEALTEANPALAQYEQVSEYVPNMGYHYGVMGPALFLAVSPEGNINAFEIIVPAEAGWYPWYDQRQGFPMDMPGVGEVYTQHLYVVDPATLD